MWDIKLTGAACACASFLVCYIIEIHLTCHGNRDVVTQVTTVLTFVLLLNVNVKC